jgi:hypothetical protein
MNIRWNSRALFLLVLTTFGNLGCQGNVGSEELNADRSELGGLPVDSLRCSDGDFVIVWEHIKGESSKDAFQQAWDKKTGGCAQTLAAAATALTDLADREGREVRYMAGKDYLIRGSRYHAITGPKYSLPACGRIAAGAALTLNNQVASCNGAFALRLNKDGSLTLYNTKVAGSNLWSTPANASVRKLDMQTDGNLILNTDNAAALDRSGNAQFMTGAFGAGTFAIVQDDGNFRVYTAEGRIRWQYGGFAN